VTRIVFAGTPDFALASLRGLVEAGHTPVAVLTQPDRPAGRGKKLTASPVKRYALERGIAVQQPASLRDARAVANFAALDPDLLVVAAYGLILPQDVLDVPRHGCLNVHASVLPRWRGAAPIQAAILAGDAKTGISLMAMTAGLDSGPVFHVEETPIRDDDTAGDLHDRLAALGAATLVAHLEGIVAGRIEPTPQDDALATYAPKIDKRDARIDWSLPAAEIARRIRAYNPFPGAFCFIADDGAPLRIKIWKAAAAGGSAAPGTVLQADRDGILVACGEGAISLEELQLPGKRRASPQQIGGQIELAGKRLD
jgi:methionyl-tRNA formyltransferase